MIDHDSRPAARVNGRPEALMGRARDQDSPRNATSTLRNANCILGFQL